MHAPTRARLALVAGAAALAAACGGGGIVALLSYVAPIGGSWQLDATPETTVLDPAAGESISFDFPATGTQYFESKYSVGGSYRSAAHPLACNALLEADLDVDIDGTGLVAYLRGSSPRLECLRGTLEGAQTMRVGALVYRQPFFSPNLVPGTWVVVDDTTRHFKFSAPNFVGAGTDALIGCQIVGAVKTLVGGTVQGTDLDAGTLAAVSEMRIGASDVWNDGQFLGDSTLQFKRGAQTLTLQRQRDATPPLDCAGAS